MSPSAELPSDPLSLADEIARTAANIDAATHRLLSCIRAFDASEEWGRQGAISCAAWLSWRIGLDAGTAREKVRVARALGSLPHIDDALRRGVLSYAKVRALTRVATPENDQQLLETALSSTGAQLERLCRLLRRVVNIPEDGVPLEERRFFREEPLEDGTVRLTVTLHADEAALVTRAIEHARLDSPAPVAHVSAEASAPHLLSKADAIVKVAESYLAHADATGSGGDRTRIVVHLDHDPLGPDHALAATLDDGTRVSAEAFRRLACDASLVSFQQAPGSAAPRLDVGRRTRTIPPALRRALSIRDRGCRFPGCSHRLFLHAHHIQHWAHGGATTPSNLLNLCSTHHRLVHEGGFTVKRSEGGEVVFKDPGGRPIARTPAAWQVVGDGSKTISAWNEEAGLTIDSETAFPGWDGEPVDYRWVVDSFASQSTPSPQNPRTPG